MTTTTAAAPHPSSDISIVHKLYRFYLAFNVAAQSFPKQDRYTVAQRCENLSLEILELAILAHGKEQRSKMLILGKMDVKLKLLKYLVRACHDVKAMNEKRYLYFEEMLQEIGRMLGGWIKSANAK